MGGSAHKVHYHVFFGGASDLQPSKTHESGDCCRDSPSQFVHAEAPIFCFISLTMLIIPENMWVVVHTRCTTMFFGGASDLQLRKTHESGDRGRDSSSQFVVLKLPIFCYIILTILYIT